MLALLLAFGSLEENAATRRRVAAPVDPDAVTISFTNPGGSTQTMDAMLDVGTFSQSGHAHGAKVTQQVAVRIDRANRAQGGTASLRASLQNADGRSVIRIDGVMLGPVPILIDANALIGAAVSHRIEVEVPASVSEGAIASAIAWEVSTN